MVEWETGDISYDIPDDTPSEVTEVIETNELPDSSDDITNILDTDRKQLEEPFESELEESILDEPADDVENFEDADAYILDDQTEESEVFEDAAAYILDDKTEEPEVFEDAAAYILDDQTEESEIFEDADGELLDSEIEEPQEEYDEEAVKVLKRDETEAWRSGNAAIDRNIEAMRDDLHDKGWPDGSELEEMLVEERSKMEDEFRRNLSGDYSNPYLGPNFPEYTGVGSEEISSEVSEESSEKEELQDDESVEVSAYDRLATYYKSHNYGPQHYSKYSKDPEWQELNNEYLTSIGKPPHDYDTD